MSRIILAEYEASKIKEQLKQFEIHQEESGNLITKFQGRIINSSKVSHIYQPFDFSNFSMNIIEQVENYFQPEKYYLRIRKGIQELRLIGEEILINGDLFYKMINILSSTDRSKALQLNIGLYRDACDNGLIFGIYGGYRTKHYKSSLSKVVEEYVNSLTQFNISVDSQAAILKTLRKEKVSFLEVARGLAYDEKDILSNSGILRIKAWSKKLLNSETDAMSDLSGEEFLLLNQPENYLEQDKVDIIIPAYQAFNTYIEIYRSYDSSILRRESDRILDLINNDSIK
jgi:hypothetical protein